MSDGYEHDDGYDGYEQDGEPSEADLVCGLLADPAVKAGLGKLVESGLDCPEDAVLAGVAAHLERCLAEYDEMRRRGADPGREWLEAAVKGEHWEASESDPPEPNWRDDPAKRCMDPQQARRVERDLLRRLACSSTARKFLTAPLTHHGTTLVQLLASGITGRCYGDVTREMVAERLAALARLPVHHSERRAMRSALVAYLELEDAVESYVREDFEGRVSGRTEHLYRRAETAWTRRSRAVLLPRLPRLTRLRRAQPHARRRRAARRVVARSRGPDDDPGEPEPPVAAAPDSKTVAARRRELEGQRR